MTSIEIITIGDELLIGHVVDTNSAYMAQTLNSWGCVVRRITSVGDDRDSIMQALRESEGHSVSIVLMTGGLGPTKDDITKQVLCDYFGTELVYRKDIREHLERHYAHRPDVLNRLTDGQCMFPQSATKLANEVGSAQVMAFEKGGIHYLSLPGVPREMEHVMQHSVKDYLLPLVTDQSRVIHRSVEVHGIAESSLAIELEEWESALPESIRLAYLPQPDRRTITLRLSGYDVEEEQVEEKYKELQILTKVHF